MAANLEAAFHLDDVDPRLVLVKAVEHDLPFAGRLVGQLDLGEADGVLGPVAAVVGGVRMNVDRVLRWGFSLATWKRRQNKKKLKYRNCEKQFARKNIEIRTLVQ